MFLRAHYLHDVCERVFVHGLLIILASQTEHKANECEDLFVILCYRVPGIRFVFMFVFVRSVYSIYILL